MTNYRIKSKFSLLKKQPRPNMIPLNFGPFRGGSGIPSTATEGLSPIRSAVLEPYFADLVPVNYVFGFRRTSPTAVSLPEAATTQARAPLTCVGSAGPAASLRQEARVTPRSAGWLMVCCRTVKISVMSLCEPEQWRGSCRNLRAATRVFDCSGGLVNPSIRHELYALRRSTHRFT